MKQCEKQVADVQTLLDLMARLRAGADGCDWCREQTFASISPYTVEEAFEVADAIATGDRAALRDELGDLLLQVVFHARMAEEEGSFSFADVVQAISDKLVRRHPQVFAGDDGYTASMADWEAIKRQERAGSGDVHTSQMDGVPRGVPALVRAQKLQHKAALAGFDWPDASAVLEKLDEEVGELKQAIVEANVDAMADELGDVMFTLVNLARHLPTAVDVEQSLRKASVKFERRFRCMEQMNTAGLTELSADELETLWQQAKQQLMQSEKGGAEQAS